MTFLSIPKRATDFSKRVLENLAVEYGLEQVFKIASYRLAELAPKDLNSAIEKWAETETPEEKRGCVDVWGAMTKKEKRLVGRLHPRFRRYADKLTGENVLKALLAECEAPERELDEGEKARRQRIVDLTSILLNHPDGEAFLAAAVESFKSKLWRE